MRAWVGESIGDEQSLLLHAFVQRGFLTQRIDQLPAKLASLVAEYRQLENAIRVPRRAPGVVEGEPWDQPFLERGNYKEERLPVPRGFLEVFGDVRYAEEGSGRRELAEDLLSDRNTLVARVLVNRLWHHVFGRGIVASTDNFGRLGKKPSHPELLDHLAAELRDGGWSMKRIVKQLVMSRTFRSAGVAPAENRNKDPLNVQLAYYAPRRLDAEAILDTIRFVAAGELESSRRAIYIRAKRNSLHPFLSAFNYPIPTSTVGVRDSTNVPAQSLTLMNGETVRRAARDLSRRIKGDRTLETDRERIDALFLQAYARLPSEREARLCLQYIQGEVVDRTAELEARRDRVTRELEEVRRKRAERIDPVRASLQAEVDRRNAEALAQGPKPVDLKPVGRWDFDGDVRDAIGSLHGELKGEARIVDGALELKGGCMMTAPLRKTLRAKTLEVLVQLDPIDQRAGGAMVVQTTDGQVFDGIVYAEVDERTWLSGSDYHRRTAKFHAPREDVAHERPVRFAIVYHEDGRTIAYRDGEPYGSVSQSYAQLGNALVLFGDLYGAMAAANKAIDLDGKSARAHLTRGIVLHRWNDPDGAIAAYRTAIAINPELAEAHCNWALALWRQKKYVEALSRMRIGHELSSKRRNWAFNSAKWVSDLEQQVARERRYHSILNGEIEVASVERIHAAVYAYGQKRYLDAVKQYVRAFEQEPPLAGQVEKHYRYHAARCAVLAATKPSLSSEDRTSWRQHALAWLRSDLEHWQTILSTPDKDDEQARNVLRSWLLQEEFATVRDSMVDVGEAEAREWKELWTSTRTAIGL